MIRRGLLPLLLVLIGSLATPVGAEEGAAKGEPAAPAKLAPWEVAREHAIERGVTFLLAHQNKNGSFGSFAPTLHDIYAPGPGSHRSFQVAATALCISALLDLDLGRKDVNDAIQRGAGWLVKHGDVRRIRPNTIYNTWAHAYLLGTLARLLATDAAPDLKTAYRSAARKAVRRLLTFEYVDGGWGYYDFDYRTRTPGRGSTSFTTATALVTLDMVRDQGITVPERLFVRGVPAIERCARPDGAFYYGTDYIYNGTQPVNQVKGSLARTPACLVALIRAGRKIKTARITKALDDLHKHGHFLQIARKYPIPHETWYQNSGYFCFYGYHYASELLGHLPAAQQGQYKRQISEALVKLQEKDGSWWDYQLMNLHKAYGTGYVLTTLARCRR